MIEKAIEWLENEIRLLSVAPKINNGEVNPEWERQKAVFQCCLDALRKQKEETDA